MKIENILVPVDFSDCSNNALHHAIQLASLTQAQLTLLHCYRVHIPAAEITIDLEPELALEYQKNAEKNFSRLRETTNGLSSVPHQEIIKINFIRDGILQTIEEVNADLIVMGTKGADNRIDAFFGSNTYSTIKKSKIPVLAIPDEAKFKPVEKLLFASDFKHLEDLHRLDIIKTLAGLFNTKVEILHVGHGWSELSMHQTKAAAAIIEYFGHTDHSYHFIKEEINVEDAIDEAIPCVVVGHSLGSIVTYLVLKNNPNYQVKKFITLGSPLGLRAIADYLEPPLVLPECIQGDAADRWYNAYDERDFIALHPLDKKHFNNGFDGALWDVQSF